MAVHNYTSWGRTRRPKNLNGTSSTAAVAVENTSNAAPTVVTEGYATENQRYLHLSVSAAGASSKLTVYVWHHAFGKWSVLTAPVGAPASSSGNMDAKSVDNAYVDVEITGNTVRKAFLFDINGADRVAFVANNATHAFTVYAACSTF